jgi:hypothetical protein
MLAQFTRFLILVAKMIPPTIAATSAAPNAKKSFAESDLTRAATNLSTRHPLSCLNRQGSFLLDIVIGLLPSPISYMQ